MDLLTMIAYEGGGKVRSLENMLWPGDSEDVADQARALDLAEQTSLSNVVLSSFQAVFRPVVSQCVIET